MAETKILEEMISNGGGFKIYFDGKDVRFDGRIIFDRYEDDWDSVYCSVNPTTYRKGLEELVEKGSCQIRGENSRMSFVKNDRVIRLDADQYRNSSQSCGMSVLLKWSPEELLEVLPL